MKFIGICLVTADVARLSGFYGRVLGARVSGDDVHAEIHTEGAGLTIFSHQGMEEMAPGCMEGSGHGAFIMGFRVEDVDAVYQQLKSLGVEVVKAPRSYPWGTRSVWFRDPDGNIVNFFTELNSGGAG